MPRQPGIYVEIFLRAPLKEVWRLTQEPTGHQRWDLRFTEIRYLPRPDESSIMFPEHGRSVPFTIQSYAHRDALGRETVTWVRTFETRKRRRFDAYIIWSEKRGCIVDYLGTHQHLAVDLEVRVAENGGLRIRSGEQRFYERKAAFRFPLLFSGVADVCEWYDDAAQCFRISVSAENRVWGKLFGYDGSFQSEWCPVEAGEVPAEILPKRVEARE